MRWFEVERCRTKLIKVFFNDIREKFRSSWGDDADDAWAKKIDKDATDEKKGRVKQSVNVLELEHEKERLKDEIDSRIECDIGETFRFEYSLVQSNQYDFIN